MPDDVLRAIAAADSVLPGRMAARGKPDPRWQAVIRVGAFIASDPDPVWHFARRWGAARSRDLRAAVATCLLEHLIEQWPSRMLPRCEDAIRVDSRFADTVATCWWVGNKHGVNYERFVRLKRRADRLVSTGRAAR